MPPTRPSVTSRVLSILEAFSLRTPRLSLGQIVVRTGLPHATAHRLVSELVRWGALVRQEDGAYCIGLRLWEIGTLAPESVPLRTLAAPAMDDLFGAVHQHVQLAVLEGREAVVIELSSAPDAVPVVSAVGGRMPLHASAAGQVLLAHAPAAVVDAVLAAPLRRFTPRTVTDPAALRAVLARVRQTGVATVSEELSPGALSVATRVTGARGEVVAALSVVLRTGTVPVASLLPAVVTAGRSISRRIREAAAAPG